MGVGTCNMCNQITPKCGCTSVSNACRKPVANILVNGQNSNQETIEFLGACIGQEIVQDGCGHKLQLTIPCVSYNDTTSILTIDGPAGVQTVDLSSLGDMDVFVNQGMFDGSNLILTDTNSNTISVDISSLASGYVQNADGSITLTSGNGVDVVTIPAECCTVSVELNGLNLETTDSLGNTIVTDLSSLVSEIVANGDGTWTHSAGGVDTIIDTNHTVTLTGTDLVVVNADGDTQTIDLSGFISTLTANANGTYTHSANGVDVVLPAVAVNTGAILSAAGLLTIQQTNGVDVTVDLSSLVTAASVEGVNQSVVLAGTTLTITDDDGDVSVDLAPLLAGIAACCNETITIGADNVLTLTQTGGSPVTVDLTAILTADNISYDNTASGSPAINVQSAIDDIYAKLCLDGFTINAGATVASTDNSLGEEVLECGDTLHFWSPDSTINFSVTPGSAVVAADVDIADILSADTGNSAIVGTDGNIFVPAIAVEGALNGVSLDASGNVVLGNDVGSTLAQLTSNREVPQGNKSVKYLGEGNGFFELRHDPSFGYEMEFHGGGSFSTIFEEGNKIKFTRDSANYIDATNSGVNTNGGIYFGFGDWSPLSGGMPGLSLDKNGDVGIATGLLTQPNSTTGKNAMLYIGGTVATGEDVVLDSGLDDYSGMVLSRLDGNSPKADCSTATPLGYDNATGLVVPYKILETTALNSPTFRRDAVFTSDNVNDLETTFTSFGTTTYTNTNNCPVNIYLLGQSRLYMPDGTLETNYNLEARFRIRANGTTLYDNFRNAGGYYFPGIGKGNNSRAGISSLVYTVPGNTTVTLEYDGYIKYLQASTVGYTATVTQSFEYMKVIEANT